MTKSSHFPPCKNCSQQLAGNFCSNCGQKSSVRKLTFKDTIQDFTDTIFSVDAPLLHTIKMLFAQPGEMLRGFLKGKRKCYYKPVAFFVLMTILYLVIRSLVGFNPLTESQGNFAGSENILLKKASQLMFANINKLLFLFVFWLGVLLKLLFYKRYSLIEYWTVAFYMVGVYIIMTTLNMFVIQFISIEIQFGAMLLIGLYFIYAFLSFFERPKWLVVLKTIFIYILSMVMYMASAFALSYVIVFFKNS